MPCDLDVYDEHGTVRISMHIVDSSIPVYNGERPTSTVKVALPTDIDSYAGMDFG